MLSFDWLIKGVFFSPPILTFFSFSPIAGVFGFPVKSALVKLAPSQIGLKMKVKTAPKKKKKKKRINK